MKGKHTESITPGHHRLEITTPVPLLISMDGEPHAIAQVGTNKLIVKSEREAILSIDSPEKNAQYAFQISSWKASRHEETNEDAPPEPAPASNYIARLREMTRDQMRILREEFADHTSIYETGNVHEFEEEQASRLDAQRASEAADNESAEQGVADQEPSDAAGGPPEPNNEK